VQGPGTIRALSAAAASESTPLRPSTTTQPTPVTPVDHLKVCDGSPPVAATGRPVSSSSSQARPGPTRPRRHAARPGGSAAFEFATLPPSLSPIRPVRANYGWPLAPLRVRRPPSQKAIHDHKRTRLARLGSSVGSGTPWNAARLLVLASTVRAPCIRGFRPVRSLARHVAQTALNG